MPGAIVQILYPRTESSTFDLDYYTSKHMPLVGKKWSEFGLKSWSVTKFGDDAPYTYGGYLEWESLEAFAKAMQSPETKEIMADIDNYSNVKPTLISGEIVASS
jgi:uncharacterized protein (TIGR02118 family)